MLFFSQLQNKGMKIILVMAITIRAQALGSTGASSVSLSSYHLPAPSDWQAFEGFTRDLFSAVWKDPRAQMNGPTGQSQASVDVFGTCARTGALEGVQCKGKDTRYGHSVTINEFKNEVDKALTFSPKLSHYYLVTSGVADVSVQKEARHINDIHKQAGRCRL